MSTTQTPFTAAFLENGRWVLRPIENSRLKTIQDLVGGSLERVPLREKGVSLFVNEEGKLRDMEPTAIWVDPDTGTWLDVLAGPVVALGPTDRYGRWTPASEACLEILNRLTIPVLKLRG